MMSTQHNAAIPEITCTTRPPAKSSACSRSLIQPPGPQTQWATGSYTNVAQSSVNITYDENFIRSANAPEMSAGVIVANMS